MTTQQQQEHCINFQDVQSAANRIKSLVHKTPVMTSTSIDQLCDNRRIFFKVEAFQRTGSFKFRGALNATMSLIEQQQQQQQQHQHQQKEEAVSPKNTSKNDTNCNVNIVTHSSGNHAAAVALAAKLASDATNQKICATIVMPQSAPEIKVNGVKGFGGEIIMCDNTNEAREKKADEIVDERNAVFIHPSENEFVIAGQGTASLEFVDQVRQQMLEQLEGQCGELDAVIIPVGGGGLAAGNSVGFRGQLKNCKIILAEPELMNDAKRSKDAGRLLGHDKNNPLNSVADGLKTTLGPNTWPIIRDLVDDIITVSEEEILRATKLVWERLKVCIEPSAGVGVAVAIGSEFRKKYPVESGVKNVGVILCGGNVDVVKVAKLMM